MMKLRTMQAERLRALLHYDPETGIFTWRGKPNGRVAEGAIAGSNTKSDYRQIRIEGMYYSSNRLAVLYMTGKWPKHLVDHRNNNKRDDKWNNLRPATRSQNNSNAVRRKDNSSGHKGVSWSKVAKKWRARISHEGKKIALGHYDSLQDAAAAYAVAAFKYHGEFARLI